MRSCPVGSAFSDVAHAIDSAHQNVVCSGRGACVEGNCLCNEGFTGIACERSKLEYFYFVYVVFPSLYHISCKFTSFSMPRSKMQE